jgi:ribosome-associated heat shock protein Hsp15
VNDATDTPALRLDIWLWRARFFRTRALSTAHIKRRGARITRHGKTRRINKPGTSIMLGDIVTFGRGAHIRSIEVLQFGDRRGPPDEARALYSMVGEDND